VKRWEIEVDGVKHEIKYKNGLSRKIIVDGETYKVKSSNIFINVIDYGISFGSTDCKLVVIGSKADLAVDGIFLESKKPYQPVSNTAPYIWVFVGISILGGFILSGIISLCIGILASMLYIQYGIQKKNNLVIGCFAACSVFQILLAFILLLLQ